MVKKLDLDGTLGLGTTSFRVAVIEKLNELIGELNDNSRQVLSSKTHIPEGNTVRQPSRTKAAQRRIENDFSPLNKD